MKAILTQGGGPTAVINASLFGAVAQLAAALPASAASHAARGGIEGVLEGRWLDLRRPDDALWRRIRVAPGAALGSCRKRLSREEAGRAAETLRRVDARYFFAIGGNDSMDTALKIAEAAAALNYELFVAGIPKTIDNDLAGTDHCPGFGSAARDFAQSAVDLGMDVRSLPAPVSILASARAQPMAGYRQQNSSVTRITSFTPIKFAPISARTGCGSGRPRNTSPQLGAWCLLYSLRGSVAPAQTWRVPNSSRGGTSHARGPKPNRLW